VHLLKPKLSGSDHLESRELWIPAFVGMTNKTQRVPVMPVPDLVRDDGSGIQPLMMLGLLGQIAQFKTKIEFSYIVVAQRAMNV
jgi:hypothetical protein